MTARRIEGGLLHNFNFPKGGCRADMLVYLGPVKAERGMVDIFLAKK